MTAATTTLGTVDAFNLMPDVFPSGLELFVDDVIPILRDRASGL